MKKIFYLFAAATLFTVGCTADDGSDVSTLRSGNSIGFISNTTRADIITLDKLKDDELGFEVYASNGEAPTGWHIDIKGENNYICKDGIWGWKNANPVWSEDSDDYPMKFFAFYADDYTYVIPDASTIGALDVAYTAATTGQVDLLTAYAKADARPAGDKVALTFKHILTKVDFGVVVGTEVKTHIQAAGFANICNNRKYKIESDVWHDQPTNMNSDYSYLDTTLDAITNSANGAIAGTRGSLMMIPQTTTSWDPTSSSTPTDAYIYVIYRLEQGTNLNSIGYADASLHPNFDEVANADLDGDPLFVKVGYPVADGDMVWESGNAYTYNINLGTAGATNGYLIDEYYYDEEGNRTTLEVENKDIGDQISDGYINFIVDVEDWNEPVSSNLL